MLFFHSVFHFDNCFTLNLRRSPSTRDILCLTSTATFHLSHQNCMPWILQWHFYLFSFALISCFFFYFDSYSFVWDLHVSSIQKWIMLFARMRNHEIQIIWYCSSLSHIIIIFVKIHGNFFFFLLAIHIFLPSKLQTRTCLIPFFRTHLLLLLLTFYCSDDIYI